MAKKILIVVGTRPNYIKISQFKKIAEHYPQLEVKIVHTGQHFTTNMSDVFFEQFRLQPDFFLSIPQASPNTQIAEVMLRLEKLIVEDFQADLVIVPGDVNSTFAAAFTAFKLGIPVAHLESGLRSNDRTMPEEINRILTDEISDYYFVTEQGGMDNLKREDKKGKSYFVGNTMIDTLVAFQEEIEESEILETLNIGHEKYILATIHRPSNVDDNESLKKICDLFEELSKNNFIVFPVHPRTIKKAKEFGFYERLNNNPRIILSEPLDYFAFQKLIAHCTLVITDSGGIQEETTYRQIPCLTLRENTERPSTISLGTNKLIGFEPAQILKEIAEIENGNGKKGIIPPFWDGKATERIVELIANDFSLCKPV